MRIFAPVIHCESTTQTLKNVEILESLDIHNCFLIGHELSCQTLIAIYEEVKSSFPHFCIGMNFLDLPAEEAVENAPDGVWAIWLDNLHIDEDLDVQEHAINIFDKKRKDFLLFGGIAFKYQKEVRDLVKVSYEAIKYCDVPTTSGDATGRAADISKIRIIKQAIRDKPLAIASGINPNNVFNYMDYVSYYLVSTGISKSFSEFDASKVEILKKNLQKNKYFIEAPLLGALSLGLDSSGNPSMSLEFSPKNSNILEKLKLKSII